MLAFLLAEYPWIKVRTRGTTESNEDDYVLIYSILLHYACVRYEDSDMQEICITFSDEYQAVLTKFFGNLLDENNFTVAFIRDAIEDAGNILLSLSFFGCFKKM